MAKLLPPLSPSPSPPQSPRFSPPKSKEYDSMEAEEADPVKVEAEEADPIKGEGVDDEDDEGEDEVLTVDMMADVLVSIEYAKLEMKEKPKDGCLRIYGEIVADTWGYPIYLFRRSEEQAEPLISSGENENVFNIPLNFPDWSLLDEHLPLYKISLYEKRDGREGTLLFDESFVIVDRGSDKDSDTDHNAANRVTRIPRFPPLSGEGYDAIHRPVILETENQQATFRLCFTRIQNACAVYVSFRILNFDDSLYEGSWEVHGSIKATQNLASDISRELTLFDTSTAVAVPKGRSSIPLTRPVLVVPVPSEEDEADDGSVAFESLLHLKMDSQSISFQATAILVLGPDCCMPFEQFCLSEIKIDDNLKMKILVTPFFESDAVYNHNDLKDYAI